MKTPIYISQKGKPSFWKNKPDQAGAVAQVSAQVKAEAERRIKDLEGADLWKVRRAEQRQSSGKAAKAYDDLLDAIEAVRGKSDAIEAGLAALSVDELLALNVSDEFDKP